MMFVEHFVDPQDVARQIERRDQWRKVHGWLPKVEAPRVEDYVDMTRAANDVAQWLATSTAKDPP